jgi:hypothetical protein
VTQVPVIWKDETLIFDAHFPTSGFTWGNGAALEAAARIYDAYGDIYLDLARKQAFELDGCTAHIREDMLYLEDRYRRVALTLATSVGDRHKIVLQDGQAVVSLMTPRPSLRLQRGFLSNGVGCEPCALMWHAGTSEKKLK